MAHTSAGGSSLASDEGNDGQVANVVSCEPGSGLFFGLTADFTNHDNTFGFGVNNESAEAIDEVSSIKRITADTNNGGLSETLEGGLVNSLVGEGAGAGDNADLSLGVDVAGHNTDLALTGLDDTGAVGSNQTGFGLRLHNRLDLDHVEGRNSLSNAHNEVHLSLDGLKDSVGSERWRHVDNGGISTSLLLCVSDVSEDRKSEMLRASLFVIDTANHLSSVGNCLLSVESALIKLL